MTDVSGTEHSALPDHVRELLRQAERADGTPPVSDQALLAVSQGKRALVDFGEAVGIIGEGELDLVVAPAARGHGLGQRALKALLEHEARGSSPELRAWAHGENPAARALLESAGFEPVRTLLRMTLDPALLEGALDASKPLPEGFEIVAFDADHPHRTDDWVRVNAAAFADHPEQGSVTRADFDALTLEPWFDPTDLRLAYDITATDENGMASPQLAGSTWVKTTQQDELVECELYVIGVDPDYAGRGLGAALLGETLRRMARHRPGRISLYVDGENTGACALYERAGFEVEQRSTQYLLRAAA